VEVRRGGEVEVVFEIPQQLDIPGVWVAAVRQLAPLTLGSPACQHQLKVQLVMLVLIALRLLPLACRSAACAAAPAAQPRICQPGGGCPGQRRQREQHQRQRGQGHTDRAAVQG
jgi:hypothetical protein